MTDEGKYFDALIRYRLEQADQALFDAELLLREQRHRAAANRLYYSCFYSATAALLVQRLQYTKHSAVITFFDKNYIKTGIFPREYSRTLHLAFAERQEDDYKPFTEPDPDILVDLHARIKQMVIGIRAYAEERFGKGQ